MSTRCFEMDTRLWFDDEKKPYKVKAANERYAVCTKPFNLHHTVIYTIIDIFNGIRGTEDLVFCAGFETTTLCEEALLRLISGESEISRRNNIPLNIVRHGEVTAS